MSLDGRNALGAISYGGTEGARFKAKNDRQTTEEVFTIPPPPRANTTTQHTSENADEDKEQTVFERIVEQGFTKFVDDMEDRKRELLREKILQSMGLTEEALQGMPAEQRAAIEKMVEDEIKLRMEAAATMNQDKVDPNAQMAKSEKPLTGAQNSGLVDVSLSAGLGPLLALQEVDAAEHAKPAAVLGKNDPLDD